MSTISELKREAGINLVCGSVEFTELLNRAAAELEVLARRVAELERKDELKMKEYNILVQENRALCRLVAGLNRVVNASQAWEAERIAWHGVGNSRAGQTGGGL